MSDICPIFVRYRVKFNETHYCPLLVNSFHSTLLTIYISVIYRKYIKAVKCYIPLYFIVISRIPTESRVRRKLAVDRQRAFLVKGAVGNPIPVKASWPKKNQAGAYRRQLSPPPPVRLPVAGQGMRDHRERIPHHLAIYLRYLLKNRQISSQVSMSASAQLCLPPTTSYSRTSISGPPFQAGSPPQ